MKDTAERGNDQAPDSGASRAFGSYDESIEFSSVDKLKGNDSNLDVGHARRMVDNGQPGSDAQILKHPPSEHDSGDIGIDNTKSPLTARRQRPHSSILLYTRTPPLPHKEDGKCCGRDMDNTDPDELSDDDSWSKRLKVSPLPGSGRAPNSLLQRFPSPILEEDEDNGPLSSPSISIAASTASTASTAESNSASEFSPSTEPKLCLEPSDANQDWEIRQIIGREDIDGVLHYMVDWCPTLLPGHSLGCAKEMVDNFEAQLRIRRQVKSRKVGANLKRGKQVVVQANALSGPQQKRRPGRPRKQS